MVSGLEIHTKAIAKGRLALKITAPGAASSIWNGTGIKAKNKKGYQSFGTLKTVFNKFSGVSDWVNDGLLINKGTLDIGKSFPTYPVEKKKEEIEKTIDIILTQNANKPQQLDSLLNQINPLVQSVFKVDVTDYVEDFVREKMVALEKAKPGYVEFEEPRSFIESTIKEKLVSVV